MKKEVRELLYECSRELIDIFEAYANGVEASYFNFVKPESKES